MNHPILFSFALIWLTFIRAISADAGEYRFTCMGEVTGLCDTVHDKEGKEVMVKLDFSDRESAVIFKEFQKKGIYGTKGLKDHEGVKWQQQIVLVGEFSSGTKWTVGGPNAAPSEPYRDFRVSGIKLGFPLWRFQECGGEDPSTRPVFMETHFSFDSLFPQGIWHNGKLIDWNQHTLANPTGKKEF